MAGYVKDLLAGAPGAISEAKHLIAECAKRSATETATLCAEAIALRRASPEGQEGIRAFLEKRSAEVVTASEPATVDNHDGAMARRRDRSVAS